MAQCCPDILHIHEWQTAAVAMLFWEHYYSCGLENARLVFTIHNLDSQGECRQEEFAATGKLASLRRLLLCVSNWTFGIKAKLHLEESTWNPRKISKPRLSKRAALTEMQSSLSMQDANDLCCHSGVPGEAFADVDKALDERTIGHNPERLCLMKVTVHSFIMPPLPPPSSYYSLGIY